MVNYYMQAIPIQKATSDNKLVIEWKTFFDFVWYNLFIIYSLINDFSTQKKMQVLYTERCSKDYNKDNL